MVGSSRRRTLRMQMQQGDAGGGGGRRRPPRRRRRVPHEPCIDIVGRLPPELLAEVHSHLHAVDFLKRLAFASVCGASGRLFRDETPCLLLGGAGDGKATVLSIADRRAATVRASDPAMRGHVVVGSSGGWLVTADARGRLRMANPVTGAQADLPDITTSSFPFLGGAGGNDNRFCLDVDALLRIRFGGPPPPPPAGENDGGGGGGWGPFMPRTFTLAAWQMGQFCYRKVVLSAAARPGRYATMLILPRIFGAPAFATADDPAWRLAPSPSGVDDAIHHRGQFYSITFSGAVEAWAHDAATGEFTSAAHAPKLAGSEEDDGGGVKVLRRYLAAAPDGRLMAVLKQSKEFEHPRWPDRITTRVVFKVAVLDEERRRWEEAADIGGTALFVGVNATLCVSAAEHRGIRPNCIYFADDEVRCRRRVGDEDSYYRYRYRDDNEEPRHVGVYSMKHGKVEKIAAFGKQEQPRWPPPAWFTPSFL